MATYPENYQFQNGANNGGVYVDPVAPENIVNYGVCNYAPKNPCLRSDFYSTTTLETKPYNPEESGLVSHVYRIAVNTALNALNSNVTLDPAISTAQQQEVSSNFYDALAGAW